MQLGALRRVATALLAAGLAAGAPAAAQTESFRGAEAPGWTLGGVARLTAAGPAPIDPVGDGWLRLTPAAPVTDDAGRQGYAFFDTPVDPDLGLHAEFDYAIYGGTGGDGLTFFLFDGATPTTSFQIGASGGSLGYAQTIKGVKASGQVHGVDKGFAGIGIDTGGNYSNPIDGRIGGPGRVPESVALRGPGDAFSDYVYVAGSPTLSPGVSTPAGRPSGPADANYRRVLVDLMPTGDGRYTLRVRLRRGTTITEVIAPTLVPPPNWNAKPESTKFGFAATTSRDGTDIHEVRDLVAAPPVDLRITKAVQSLAGQTISHVVTVTNIGVNADPYARVEDSGVPGTVGRQWTCSASSGAACVEGAGTGALDTHAILPPGGSVTYVVSAQLTPLVASPVVNTATVTASAAVADVDLSNNVASASVTLTTDVVLTKSAPPTYEPGSPLTYAIDVVNTSGVWVLGSRVRDTTPLAATGTWRCDVVTPPVICRAGTATGPLDDVLDLGPNAAARYLLTVVPPASATGPLANTATVVVSDALVDINVANNTSTVVSLPVRRADLAVTKTSAPRPYSPGEPVVYTVVVSNAGPSDVAIAHVHDVLPPDITGVTWTCTATPGAVCAPAGTGDLDEQVVLAAGSSVTYHITGAAPPTLVQLINTVTVEAPAGVVDPVPGNNTAVDANPLRPPADLAISKSVTPEPYSPGQPLTYRLTVTNLGPTDVSNARVQDALPPELDVAAFTWTCASSGAGATCPPTGTGDVDALVSLDVGASLVFTVTGPAPTTAGVTLSNTATVTAPLDVSDLALGNNSATVVTSPRATADLRIEKSSAPSPYLPGGELTTTIVVTNDGPDDVIDARVVDVATQGSSAATWSCHATGGGSCSPQSGTGQIDAFVSLADGETATFTVTTTAPSSAGAVIVNAAAVSAPAGVLDPDPGNNHAVDANPHLAGPDLAITLQADRLLYTPGESLAYTITVTNNGPLPAEHARVRDVLPSALSAFAWTCTPMSGGATCGRAAGVGPIDALVSLPVAGASVSFAVSGTVPATTRGPLVSKASVELISNLTDPVADNDAATVVIAATPITDLSVTLTSVPLRTFTPTQPLVFVLAVRNAGDATVPAGLYTVSSTLPAELAPASWTCTVAPSGSCGVVSGALQTGSLPALTPGASLLFTLRTVVPSNVLTALTAAASVALAVPGLELDTTNNDATWTVYGAASFATGIVGGVVTDVDGAPLAGHTMQLTGAASLEAQTSATGRYSFIGLPLGHTYIVDPASSSEYVFTPPRTVFERLAGPARADFVALGRSYRRYFPEGVSSGFFTTTFALTNPGDTVADVSFRFQRPEGPEVLHALTLEPRQYVIVDPGTLPDLQDTAFSTVIDADAQIVSSRTTSWDRSGYGTHRGNGIGRARTRWYMAEGATIAGFSLFYLIQNPGDVPASVTVRYLIQEPGVEPIERSYVVAPRSRYTIAVHDDPELRGRELSADISTDGVPIVVERSLYRSGPRVFEAGTGSTAVPAPSTTWSFAEGATGPYFDMFLLLANPGSTSLSASIRYLLPTGGAIEREVELPAGVRRTIWVDYEDPLLADTAVSVVVNASGAIVAERAMWWPGSAATWVGGHSSPGSTHVAPRWGVTGLTAGGSLDAQPWILIANPSDAPTTVRMTLIFEDGRAPVVADYPVAALGRFTIDVAGWHPDTAGSAFAAIVEQVDSTSGILVESAVYHDSGGVTWAAGRAGQASPIP